MFLLWVRHHEICIFSSQVVSCPGDISFAPSSSCRKCCPHCLLTFGQIDEVHIWQYPCNVQTFLGWSCSLLWPQNISMNANSSESLSMNTLSGELFWPGAMQCTAPLFSSSTKSGVDNIVSKIPVASSQASSPASLHVSSLFVHSGK